MTPPNHISGDFVRRRAQPGHWRFAVTAPAQGLNVTNHSTFGAAPRADLPENAPAKAVGVDCGARSLKTHPVVESISHGWYFDDPVFLKYLTFTLAGDMDRNVIPTRVATTTLSLAEK